MQLSEVSRSNRQIYILGASSLPANSDAYLVTRQVVSELDRRGYPLATYIAQNKRLTGIPQAVCEAARTVPPSVIGLGEVRLFDESVHYEAQMFGKFKPAIEHILNTSHGFFFVTPDLDTFALATMAWELIRQDEISHIPMIAWSPTWMSVIKTISANPHISSYDLDILRIEEGAEHIVTSLTKMMF
jgi:hypothetical protein